MNMVMMSEKAIYLQMIESAIARYDRHSLVIKCMALFMGAGLFLARLVTSSSLLSINKPALVALMGVTGVGLLFVVWLTDAHFNHTKNAFTKLYEKACAEPAPSFEMNPHGLKDASSLKIVLWAQPMAWLYLSLIIAVAVMSLMPV